MLKQIKKLIIVLLIWLSLPLFLFFTNPEKLPLPLLLVPFILLIISLYITSQIVLKVFFIDVMPARRKFMSGLIAVLPTLLILLASIRQLTIRDTAIVFGLIAVLMFYLRRLDFIKNT